MSQPNLFTELDLEVLTRSAKDYFTMEGLFKKIEKSYNEAQSSLTETIQDRLFDSIKDLYFKTTSPEDSKHYLAGCILKPISVVVTLTSPENIYIGVRVEVVQLGPNSYESDLGRIWQEIPENLIPVDYEPA
jgi:hypothetical protein